MRSTERSIGPLGTGLRIVVALALVYIAGGAGEPDWHLDWDAVVGGLVAVPALTLALGLAANRYASRPLRFTGPFATMANCGLIVALVINPYTASAATLFYAAALLIGAWRGQMGCEGTVISNWILGRDDQVGCPIFSPIDAAEARFRRRSLTADPR
jgi:hypothetical protein